MMMSKKIVSRMLLVVVLASLPLGNVLMVWADAAGRLSYFTGILCALSGAIIWTKAVQYTSALAINKSQTVPLLLGLADLAISFWISSEVIPENLPVYIYSGVSLFSCFDHGIETTAFVLITALYWGWKSICNGQGQ